MNLIEIIREHLTGTFWSTYSELTSGMRDGVLIIDREGKIVYTNPAMAAILGRAGQKLTGQTIREALAEFPELFMLCGHEELLTEVALETNEGPRYYDMHVLPIKKRRWQKHANRLIVLHNIAQRVQALNTSRENERLLKQSEEKYRYLVENINEIITTVDLEGNITYLSPSAEQFYGYFQEEMIGKSYLELVYSDDRPALESYFIQLIAGAASKIEFRAINRHGDVRDVLLYSLPILQNEKLVGLLGVASDITDQRLIQQALERRASQLAMVNKIGEQIAAAMDLKRVIDSATTLIQKSFGYYHVGFFIPDWNRGELVLRSSSGFFSEFFPENHHLKFGQGMVGWCANNRSILLANDVRLEPRYTNLYPERILTRSELVVPVLAGENLVGVLDIQSPQVGSFEDNDVRVMKTVADQIAVAIENARLYEEIRRQLNERERLFEEVDGARSELEKRAEELEEANARLRELDRLKSQFLANMSHELRTPLNSIIGFSEVLADGLAGHLNDEQSEFTYDILSSGRHLLALINDLLDFSKIEADRVGLEPGTFHVKDLFDELRGSIAPLIEKKNQKLTFSEEENLPLLYADRMRVMQVFINLLSNANKFTPAGGSITVSCREAEPGYLLFAVIDTGIGIRKEDQEIIFEEFRQVDGSLTREVPGTGLGLTISRRLIELHGGRIWVESTFGKGTTFYVSLPAQSPPTAVMENDKLAQDSKPEAG